MAGALSTARAISVPLFTALLAQGAYALNWEGHEESWADLPAARAFEDALGDKRPLRPKGAPKPCTRREDVGRVQENPYEQVAPLCGERRPIKR
jgi:hypothetical protein